MVSDYHLPRWQLFVQMIGEALVRQVPFNQSAFDDLCYNTIEFVWANAHNPDPSTPQSGMCECVCVCVRMFCGNSGLKS